MLRERYESRESTVFQEAASKLTTAVYDILSIVVENNGATYDVLAEKTGLARSTVRYHVSRLAERGILKRVGNPVLVAFESWALRDRAAEKIREARPERTQEDRREEAENVDSVGTKTTSTTSPATITTVSPLTTTATTRSASGTSRVFEPTFATCLSSTTKTGSTTKTYASALTRFVSG